MKIFIISVLIVLLVALHGLILWVGYKSPVQYLLWGRRTGALLLLGAAGILLYRQGIFTFTVPGAVGILYGVAWLLATGSTVRQTVCSDAP